MSSSDDASDVLEMEQMEIGGGNTNSPPKRVTQGKRWCFTYNNYTVVEMEQMEHVLKQKALGYIFQEEVGDGSKGDSPKGTPHLQGYYETAEKSRWSELKLPFKPHFEKAKGTRMQNMKYCSKVRTAVHGGGRTAHFSLNFRPPRPLKLLTEDMLRAWQKGVIDIVNQEPDDRSLFWIWSANGNVGKTTFCKYLTATYGAVPLAGKGADVRNGVVTYLNDKKTTPELIVVPIPRSFSAEYVSYEAMENCKDMYFYSGKYEGGAVCGNCPHVFVFANFAPDTSKMSEDRWKVWQIDGPDPDGFWRDQSPKKKAVLEAMARGCQNARDALSRL